MRLRLRSFRHIGFAAWLGLVALAINAYVPVHLAYDVSSAISAAADEHGSDHHAGHAHHHHDDGEAPGGDHPSHPAGHRDCQVCITVYAGGSVGLLAVLDAPRPTAAAPWIDAALAGAERPIECPASYVSRAPPSFV
jgi:hypothetical protein